MCLLRGGKREFLSAQSLFSGDQYSNGMAACLSAARVILAVSGPVRSKRHLHCTPVSQRESMRLEVGHIQVPLVPLVHCLRCSSLFLREMPFGKIDYPVKASFRLYLTGVSPSVQPYPLKSTYQLPNFPTRWAVLISPALIWFLLLLLPPHLHPWLLPSSGRSSVHSYLAGQPARLSASFRNDFSGYLLPKSAHVTFRRMTLPVAFHSQHLHFA